MQEGLGRKTHAGPSCHQGQLEIDSMRLNHHLEWSVNAVEQVLHSRAEAASCRVEYPALCRDCGKIDDAGHTTLAWGHEHERNSSDKLTGGVSAWWAAFRSVHDGHLKPASLYLLQ
jgi:hypothetical protein